MKIGRPYLPRYWHSWWAWYPCRCYDTGELVIFEYVDRYQDEDTHLWTYASHRSQTWKD